MSEVRTHELIHCIGDSHVSLFSGVDYLQNPLPHPSVDKLPQFRVHRIGPGLAYNLCKEGTTTRSRERMIEILEGLTKGSRVMLSFGEVDCRAHLIQQAEKSGQDWNSITQSCAHRYIEGAEIVKEMGFQLIIYNVIPSSRHTKPGKAYPTSGSCLERNEITILFNQAVAQICHDKGTPFIQTFFKLVNDSKLTRSIYYFDKIHLSQRALPLTVSALAQTLPNFRFAPPPHYKLHILRSWFHSIFCEKKRFPF